MENQDSKNHIFLKNLRYKQKETFGLKNNCCFSNIIDIKRYLLINILILNYTEDKDNINENLKYNKIISKIL